MPETSDAALSKVSRLALDLFAELRKETLEAQRLRTQVIGFKITFVSAAVGFVYSYKAPRALLLIPALASIFFDLLISSYSISIRRIGLYCKTQLEEVLKKEPEFAQFPFWEKFFDSYRVRPKLAWLSNLGFTGMAVFLACVELSKLLWLRRPGGLTPALYLLAIGLLWLVLAALFLYDIMGFMIQDVIIKDGFYRLCEKRMGVRQPPPEGNRQGGQETPSEGELSRLDRHIINMFLGKDVLKEECEAQGRDATGQARNATPK